MYQRRYRMNKVLFISLLGLSSLFGESLSVVKSESWGVEFNPLRLLVFGDNETSLSGTFSYFDNENSVEIAVPWLYYKDSGRVDWNLQKEYREKSILVDVHYRKYFTPNTEGAYVGAFGRYAHLAGELYVTEEYKTVNKFGLGLEVGFKLKNIFDSPFYYGASIALGGYLGNENDVFNSHDWFSTLSLDDNRKIIDIELLKIGYEF